jgi:biopolymer transport protein TolR
MAGGTSSGGVNRRGRRSINAEINITPLVDVMLVLLIIFMVTSPMLVAGIKVDLPDTQATPLSGQDEPISVDIDKEGQVYIQENLITTLELAAKLKAISNEKYDSRIFVRGDKNTDYGKIMEVIGAINEAGFNKVSLITGIKTSHRKK